jgi:hypothetical protein
MRNLKAICSASILALALTVTVYAGDIDTPGYMAPVPAQIPSASGPVAAGYSQSASSNITTLTDLLLTLVGLL